MQQLNLIKRKMNIKVLHRKNHLSRYVKGIIVVLLVDKPFVKKQLEHCTLINGEENIDMEYRCTKMMLV
ncbi:hypothetical protein BGM21_04060 [Geobacillus thermoleovorans]|jgi:hypothetical protein|nr:hypothetical protein GHH_c08260 [Geobacillus sp. GHH01]AOL33757.1 hypothetical protein BGM21_04060 [Geobacillus thermoleovorans]